MSSSITTSAFTRFSDSGSARSHSVEHLIAEHKQRDVLLLSMRRVSDLVAYCLAYEFEDVVAGMTVADRVQVSNPGALELSRRAYKMLRRTTRSSRIASTLAPNPAVVRLQRDYELFFPVFSHPYELYGLATVPDWRDHCRTAACFITEVWSDQLPDYLLELLSEFDHIFLGSKHAVDSVAKIVGRPVSYLPMAADVLRFAPLPHVPGRSIDLLNIGRRSQVTHRALLKLADEQRIFYYYDTIAAGADAKQRTFRVDAPDEHRRLLASLLKRSRYFIANRSLVNQPDFTAGREEISARFYEGAASGTVMLGEAPRTEEFARQFDWPDAVIHLPFDSADVGDIMAELDRDPQRLARARRNNLHHAALRHDWVHRMRIVCSHVGMEPTSAMLQREQRLDELSKMALDATHAL